MNVYTKKTIPERLNYGDSDRVLPILITADEGYIIKAPEIKGKVYPEEEDDDDRGRPDLGYHGYDAEYVSEMRTIFYGFGPGLRSGYLSKPLEMVDHYNLFCKLLDIKCRKNDGSKARAYQLLKEAEESSEESEESDEDSDEDYDDDDGAVANKISTALLLITVARVLF